MATVVWVRQEEVEANGWHGASDGTAPGMGRRIGGGTWSVSKVALAMFLDGDQRALRAYHAGDRTSELIAGYFERSGLGDLVDI